MDPVCARWEQAGRLFSNTITLKVRTFMQTHFCQVNMGNIEACVCFSICNIFKNICIYINSSGTWTVEKLISQFGILSSELVFT